MLSCPLFVRPNLSLESKIVATVVAWNFSQIRCDIRKDGDYMELLEAVKNAGIVGAGGAGFPTHVKLSTKAEIFIVNAAECEPLIETDKFICRNYADDVISAVRAVAAHLGVKRSVIAIKRKYKEEIAALSRAIEKSGGGIEIFGMGTFYPAGDEQIIVQMITGRTVPERGIPIEVGAVVNNVGTMLNVHDALSKGEGVYRKFLSVTGEVSHSVMMRAPVGTPITECIKAASPLSPDYAVVLGGPMMGRVIDDRDAIERTVVTKTTGNLLVLPRGHYLVTHFRRPLGRIKAETHAACIQCRMCTDLCPRYQTGHMMRPHLVMRNLFLEQRKKDDSEFIKAYGDAANCCGCAVCELFSCPMGLSPKRVNDYMKVKLRERGLDVPKNGSPCARPEINLRRVPTERLVARLNLSKYYPGHAGDDFIEIAPKSIFVPFHQHIGKPAEPVKKVGDSVAAGELIAKAAEGLSANVHAGISGTITEIGHGGVRITTAREG